MANDHTTPGSIDDIKATLREYVLHHHLQGEDSSTLKDDTPLRTSGIIDSLGIIDLVSFLEQRFGIEFEAHETSVEHFDRLNDLAALIATKTETRA